MEKTKHLYKICKSIEGTKIIENAEIEAYNKKEVETYIKNMGSDPVYWDIEKIY